MNNEQREKYNKLKEENKKKIKRKEKMENTLLKECIISLGRNCEVLDEEKEFKIYNKFKKSIKFSNSGVIWNNMKSAIKIEDIESLKKLCSREYYYIIWGLGLPILECNIRDIIKNINDVIAVSPDTWVISREYDELIEFYHEGNITYGLLKW